MPVLGHTGIKTHIFVHTSHFTCRSGPSCTKTPVQDSPLHLTHVPAVCLSPCYPHPSSPTHCPQASEERPRQQHPHPQRVACSGPPHPPLLPPQVASASAHQRRRPLPQPQPSVAGFSVQLRRPRQHRPLGVDFLEHLLPRQEDLRLAPLLLQRRLQRRREGCWGRQRRRGRGRRLRQRVMCRLIRDMRISQRASRRGSGSWRPR